MPLRPFTQPAVATCLPTLDPAAAQAPASNTLAVWTLAADTTGKGWMVYVVRWSYSGTPSAGSLTVAWTDPTNGAQSEVYAITAAGPGYLPMNKAFPPNTAVTVTLAAAGVTGTVYGDAYLD